MMINPENRYLAAFSDYLITQGLVPDKFLSYYIEWVREIKGVDPPSSCRQDFLLIVGPKL